jgi:hypothetical protein
MARSQQVKNTSLQQKIKYQQEEIVAVPEDVESQRGMVVLIRKFLASLSIFLYAKATIALEQHP